MPIPKVMTDHHRCPTSLGGGKNPENISMLDVVKHRAWHILFKNYTVHVIAKLINKLYLDPAWEFIVVPRRKKVRR